MRDSFAQRKEERAEDQAAAQRPAATRDFMHWPGGESECQSSWKGSRGSEPWRSAYLRNEAKFLVALDVGGTATPGGAYGSSTSTVR